MKSFISVFLFLKVENFHTQKKIKIEKNKKQIEELKIWDFARQKPKKLK